MKFEWDENKNEQNILKHGIDFVDVPDFFDSSLLVRIDNRHDYDEERFVATGILKQFIVVVVYVERVEDTYRIISARQASKNERKEYYAIFKN